MYRWVVYCILGAAGLCAAFGIEIGHHEEPQVASHLLATAPRHTFVECFDEIFEIRKTKNGGSQVPHTFGVNVVKLA